MNQAQKQPNVARLGGVPYPAVIAGLVILNIGLLVTFLLLNKNGTTEETGPQNANVNRSAQLEPSENGEPEQPFSEDPNFKIGNKPADIEWIEANKPVNMNTASKTDLTRFYGIGNATALRIVEGRPWKSLDDLFEKINWFKPPPIEIWKDYMTVDP